MPACCFLQIKKQCVPHKATSAATLNSLYVTCLQIFGEQISYGSPYDRPEVLDFPAYAACRFLDTSPNNPVSLHPCCRLSALCMQLMTVQQACLSSNCSASIYVLGVHLQFH